MAYIQPPDIAIVMPDGNVRHLPAWDRIRCDNCGIEHELWGPRHVYDPRLFDGMQTPEWMVGWLWMFQEVNAPFDKANARWDFCSTACCRTYWQAH